MSIFISYSYAVSHSSMCKLLGSEQISPFVPLKNCLLSHPLTLQISHGPSYMCVIHVNSASTECSCLYCLGEKGW
ncbi:hypothetical protein V8C40DRAFT_250249 [Trichoderma camerunense]